MRVSILIASIVSFLFLIGGTTAAYSQQQQQTVRSDPYRVGIFPCAGDYGHAVSEWDRVIKYLHASVQSEPDLVLAYSYYDDAYNSLPIRKPDSLWARGAAQAKPKVPAARALGREHNVDAVVMCSMTVDGMAHSAWPGADDELTLGLYMIDVEREQVYRSNGASRKVKKIANKVFAKYLEDHSRVMPTAVAATGAAAVSQPAQPIAKESSATVAPVTVAKAAPVTGGATGPMRTITLPSGTQIFGELESRVSSSKKGGQAQVGDLVKAHVWRDVVVDNHVVIKAGAPMVMKVGAVKGAQLAGIKGKIRVDAVSVNAVDGSQITLTGGYDGSGKGRVGTIAAVWVAVGVFALLVKGHEVVVEPGVVFDAALLQPATIAAYGPPIPPKQPDPVIQVEVLYDLIDLEKKLKKLPLRIRRCNASLADARVVAVNGSDILDPIPVKLESTQPDGNCTTAEGTIKMKALLGHFNKGINLFEVEAGGQRKEVLLELEL